LTLSLYVPVFIGAEVVVPTELVQFRTNRLPCRGSLIRVQEIGRDRVVGIVEREIERRQEVRDFVERLRIHSANLR
jgi:hypothetical protein